MKNIEHLNLIYTLDKLYLSRNPNYKDSPLYLRTGKYLKNNNYERGTMVAFINVDVVEFPKLTPQQWRDNYDAGIKAIKASEVKNEPN